MSNFHVGDRVVVVKNNHPGQGVNQLLSRGVVEEVTGEDGYEVGVDLDGLSTRLYFDSSELELEGVYDALSKKPSEEPLSDDSNVDKRSDAVDHPSHYTSHPSGVECKDIIGHYSFFIGSAMKYLWRAGLKEGNPPIQDLQKAIKNIEFEIERLGGTVANS